MDYEPENNDSLDILDEQEASGDMVEEAAENSNDYIVQKAPVMAMALDNMNVEELRQYAAKQGIDLGSAKKRHTIIDIILAAPEAAPEKPQFTLVGLYEHMPPGFLKSLTQALHARGLVEPSDYFKAGASERFRSAVLSVIRHDFSSAQALAKDAWVKKAEGR